VGCVVAWYTFPWLTAVIFGIIFGAGAGRLVGDLLGAVGWSSVLGAVASLIVGDMLCCPTTGAVTGLMAGAVLALKGRPIAVPSRPGFAFVGRVALLAVAYAAVCWLSVEACSDCLPRDVGMASQFGDGHRPMYPTGPDTITVGKALFRLGAYRWNGVIVDRWGREIRFIWIPGEHPRGEKYERKANEVYRELQQLKRHYTVVEMFSWQPCRSDRKSCHYIARSHSWKHVPAPSRPGRSVSLPPSSCAHLVPMNWSLVSLLPMARLSRPLDSARGPGADWFAC
jgi:hypothetical protein